MKTLPASSSPRDWLRSLPWLGALPRESRDTLFLLAVIGWIVLMQSAHMPWSTTVFGLMVLSWRAWLTLDWAKKGRAFNWDLHAVFGTWALLFYLCASLTGLYWSYDWYRDGMTRLLSDAPAGEQGRRPRRV